MKKALFIATLFTGLFATNVKSQVMWPNGKADFQTPTVTTKVTAQTITVTNRLTWADLGTIDTNKVLTVVAGANVPKGSILVVKYVADATARTIASTTGCSCVTYTSTASKANIIHYMYDGTTFYCLSLGAKAEN